MAGYDGSAGSSLAVRWAAQHAPLLDAELLVVHCSLWPLFTQDLGPVQGISDSGLRHHAQAVLDQGAAEALTVEPTLRIRTVLLDGLPTAQLRRLSNEAAMLVLGSRGTGGFLGLLVGSVSLELAATANCPVAVVRLDPAPEGPIVVGIDSTGSPVALHDACVLAEAMRTDVVIVHVLRLPFSGGRDAAAPRARREARALLGAAAASARTLSPGGSIHEELIEETSVPRALLNSSRGAGITVVGTKSQRLARGTIGSTAHAVLHHATGPVLISRERPIAKIQGMGPGA
ncbi:universal stress protein [Arthrobacter sp. SLBN-100]|uniref:universal stress protein n=1 Tax=Arthrobacter sp. SLBN-100 TaxID=2768450 RepID=UPI001F1BCF7A|nr:universal stress protein [Arthrobacter sp. SLBN-100]